MQKICRFFTALLLGILAPSAFSHNQAEFVSLTLCTDRLLAEIARPEQIAAMSPYSQNPQMMLDWVNRDKPTLEPQLTALLPYLDKTLLINQTFYPQLVADLNKLGVKILPINDNPQTPAELFELILQLGNITGNKQQAREWVKRLTSQHFHLNRPLAQTLILSETGLVDTDQAQYRTLLALLGLTPLKTKLTPQNFSLEKILRSQPNFLISLTDQQSYNEQAELLTHPLWQDLFQNRPLATLPMKYTYCFDHGIWMGAERIYRQIYPINSD